MNAYFSDFQAKKCALSKKKKCRFRNLEMSLKVMTKTLGFMSLFVHGFHICSKYLLQTFLEASNFKIHTFVCSIYCNMYEYKNQLVVLHNQMYTFVRHKSNTYV